MDIDIDVLYMYKYMCKYIFNTITFTLGRCYISNSIYKFCLSS